MDVEEVNLDNSIIRLERIYCYELFQKMAEQRCVFLSVVFSLSLFFHFGTSVHTYNISRDIHDVNCENQKKKKRRYPYAQHQNCDLTRCFRCDKGENGAARLIPGLTFEQQLGFRSAVTILHTIAVS